MAECDICARGVLLQIGRLEITRASRASLLAGAVVAIAAGRDLLGLIARTDPDPMETVRELAILAPVAFLCFRYFVLRITHAGHERRVWSKVWQTALALLAMAYAVQLPWLLAAARARQ